MFTLLKILQQFFKALHSEGTPGQIAAGMALGSCLGLTPLINLHNLFIVGLLIILNVSFSGGMLAFALFAPVGFLLDPVFDAIGQRLLTEPTLQSQWTDWYNSPILPYSNFNNTVVLGSVVGWVLLAIPIFVASRVGVIKYRATIAERLRNSRFYRGVRASRLYNIYRWFQP